MPRPRRRNAGGPLDTHAARELELYVENDAQLHRSQEQPIQKNLITKMARGVYNHAGAVKLYGYLMESGAKKYIKEHGSVHAYTGRDEWHQVFSPATRKAAAETFAKSFETEAKLGNYDHMLPKKYAGWSGKTGTIPNGRLVPARIRHNGHTYAGKVKRVNGRVKIFVTPKMARKINPRANLTQKYWPIQGRYGRAWEEVTAEEWKHGVDSGRKEAVKRLREYRENEPGTAFRLVLKREKIA